MLKALLDTIKFKFDLESFFLFFVLGFVFLPVISWQSEYDTDCKEALLEIRQYLTGEEKLKYSEEELIDVERCYRSRACSH